ncbi:PRC-barrel domain-containing protein [Marinitenerispora sediminis]|uniref:PRC-barrel domain-containing protein n=1 Tax=Marinitenerispora sediminis TaxID=1931232 RepID=UPI0018F1E84E|nr:PRC-barrel domain-containing protein [Marinitenerispora sediminis]
MAPQLGAQRLIGHRLLDRQGNSVGKIGQVYFDDQTDAPKWVTVRSGFLGTRENFVPLQGARTVQNDLQVPFDKDTIRRAPSFDIDQHISVEQEDRVYQHYGLQPEVPGQRSAAMRESWGAPGPGPVPPEALREPEGMPESDDVTDVAAPAEAAGAEPPPTEPGPERSSLAHEAIRESFDEEVPEGYMVAEESPAEEGHARFTGGPGGAEAPQPPRPRGEMRDAAPRGSAYRKPGPRAYGRRDPGGHGYGHPEAGEGGAAERRGPDDTGWPPPSGV